jgi:hypothetical protein
MDILQVYWRILRSAQVLLESVELEVFLELFFLVFNFFPNFC